MHYPAELYMPSRKAYLGLPELSYPFHDMTITVTECGRLCFGRPKNQSQSGLCRSERGGAGSR
jgi:putative transposase